MLSRTPRSIWPAGPIQILRGVPLRMTNGAREKFLLDRGWLFHPGDIESPVPNTHIAAYMNHKAGWSRGAARANYDDSDWRALDLPHDWSVEGKFDPEHHVDNGFLPRGIGWDRRPFRL